MQKSIYEPNLDRIKGMDVKEATSLFRELLWCESERLGLKNIHVSGDTDTADGGIDASAERVDTSGSKKGDFYFQIKAGKSFKPWEEAAARKELFGKAAPSKPALGSAVRACLDASGVYVLVAMGHELVSKKAIDARNLFLDLFKKCGYSNAKVEVWGADQIGKFIERYPSLALDLNFDGRPGEFRTVATWSTIAGMSSNLELGEPQTTFIEETRRHLLDPSVRHVRIVGEPGAGKSRLVLEAIAGEKQLAYKTIYFEQASEFQRSPLLNELLKTDREYWALIVLDDCDERDRSSIYALVRSIERIKLISIDHGPDDSSDPFMKLLRFPPLALPQVESILRSYMGPRVDVHRWVQWCEGSARVAHAVGENLQRNPEDLLRSPATVDLWGRFIQGHSTSTDSRQVETVLEHIALFQRFGFKRPVESEGRFIADLVSKVDPNVTHGRFDQIVAKLMGRRILQGAHTLRIVPKALHLHLWSRWWKTHGATVDLNDLMAKIPGALHRWFLEMLPYANGVESARSAIKEILTDQASQFESKEFISSKPGSDFLRAMATAEPAATLSSLKRSLGGLSPADLESLGDARSNLTGALCVIAVWRFHFPDAAELLWKLTHGDDSKYSNNTLGSLKGLFNLVAGATQATGQERLAFATSKLRSVDPVERRLAVELCNEILNVRGGIRIVGVEHQGMLDDVPFWSPTWNDCFQTWRNTLAALESGDVASDSDWQCIRSRALINAGDEMLQFSAMQDLALDILDRQLAFDGADRNALAKTIVHRLKYPFENTAQGTGAAVRLADILSKLGAGPFKARFDRNVVFELYEEDYEFDKDQKLVENDAPRKAVLALAKEFVEQASTGYELFPLALSSTGHRIAQFAADVADAAPDGALDGPLLTMAEFLDLEYEPLPASFIASYLSQVRKGDPSRWEELALAMLDLHEDSSADGETGRWRLLGVVWSGASSAAIAHLLALLDRGLARPSDLGALRYEVRSAGVPAADVEAIVMALIDCDQEGGAAQALMVAHDWAVQAELAMSESVLWKVISDGRTVTHNNAVHYWERVVDKYRTSFPKHDSKLLKAMVRLMSGSWSSGYQLSDAASKVISKMCVDDPKAAWQEVSKALDGGPAQWQLSRRLSGINGGEAVPAICAFNVDDVIAWVKQIPEKRSRSLVAALPQTLDAGSSGELTRRFIEEFAGDDVVASRVKGHFDTGLRMGPASNYLSTQRDQARRWLASAPAYSRLRKWLGEFIEELSDRIDRARISEERGF